MLVEFIINKAYNPFIVLEKKFTMKEFMARGWVLY